MGSGGGPCLACRQCLVLCSHVAERERERERRSSLVPFLVRALIPSGWPHPHDVILPNYLPEVPSPDAIPMRVKASTYDFGGMQCSPWQLVSATYFEMHSKESKMG